jgi:DNA-directed RNA polymerase subunit RPC12/RpoP
MGSHNWMERCPYCGFEQMQISSYNSLYFETTCQMCGYAVWTKEKIPNNCDIRLAKQLLSKMSTEEKEKVIELFSDDGLPFFVRFKRKTTKGE